MKHVSRVVALVLGLLAGVSHAQDVRKIWDEPGHAAFTDLTEFRGELVCTFRESDRHVGGTDGVIRVIRSTDGESWESAALVELEGTDLRDPKLSVTQDGRLMLLMGGSVYDGRTLVRRGPLVAFADGLDEGFGGLTPVEIDPGVRTDNDWLWRVTWHGGVAWGVVYQSGSPDERYLQLLRSSDGISYELVTTLEVTGQPNETTLRFDADGRMIALVRREGDDPRGVVGVAGAPYRDWSWSELPVRLGGPNFVVLPGGAMIAGSRAYPTPETPGTRTVLASLGLDGSWEELRTLPSGGDTSYPGMVVRGDRLLVSYYSSHEGRTSIYMADLWLSGLTE